MIYTDIIIATKKLCREKNVDAHFVDQVTNESEFKENIRFYDVEKDWIKPDWKKKQPITWQDVLNCIDTVAEDIAKQECKKQAKKLLADSDWAATVDVQQALENSSDWLFYRETVRNLFLNPTTNPTFPNVPEVRWKI